MSPLPAADVSLNPSNVDTGMVLPFQPMTMTFKAVHYWVNCPPDMQNRGLPNVNEKNGKQMLELLRGISGAFRPGVMTCLMGVSGAGETLNMLAHVIASCHFVCRSYAFDNG